MKARPKRNAFTVVEVLVLIFVLCLLAVMVIPMLQGTRVKSDWGSCVNRVKQIGLNFRLWAEDNGGSFPMQTRITNGGTLELASLGDAAVHFVALSNYLSTPTAVWCPQDTDRTRASSFSMPFANSNVSYFVNVGAAASSSNVLLAGDRKLTVDEFGPLVGCCRYPAAAWLDGLATSTKGKATSCLWMGTLSRERVKFWAQRFSTAAPPVGWRSHEA